MDVDITGRDFDGDKLNNEIWSNSSGSADCISVNGGKLTMKITADENKEKREPYITTRNKFSQQYGCFTARMLMPKTTETSVSAFWLLPSNYNNHICLKAQIFPAVRLI